MSKYAISNFLISKISYETVRVFFLCFIECTSLNFAIFDLLLIVRYDRMKQIIRQRKGKKYGDFI